MSIKLGAEDEEGYRPCRHLSEYRSNHGLRGFRVLQKCLQSGCSPGRWSIRREQREVPTCITCGKTRGRLYACLVCANINCNDHLHAQARSGHNLAVDLDRAELYCCVCNDQVYDPDFDRFVLCATQKKSSINTITSADNVILKNNKENNLEGRKRWDGDDTIALRLGCRKRRRLVEYKAWAPGPGERALIRHRTRRLNGVGGEDCLPWGLRGLNNLGNTCFMNSVLQTLLHTPPLRNYFLSDRHNRSVCRGKGGSNLCIGCDMDDVFSASFSGDRTPYSPAQFLYSWWQHAANFAGYEQQDAHEFFISTIDGIHANSGFCSPMSRHSHRERAGGADCQCIAHKVFSGVLRSDVTCTVCSSTSTTFDPCVDISLDLKPNTTFEKDNSTDFNKSNGEDKRFNKKPSLNLPLGTSTLLGCLDRFTRPERLGLNEKFYCQHCQTHQESIKQMSVRKLPLVLCFHIKRFEHSPTRHTSKKVDCYMQFPFSLDMAPYMSSSIVRLRYGNRIMPSEANNSDTASTCGRSLSKYDLFAVVTHSGGMDSGHYISYLKLREKWYKCDDAWVNQVSEQAVRASQGYMLYYVQKIYSYGASES